MQAYSSPRMLSPSSTCAKCSVPTAAPRVNNKRDKLVLVSDTKCTGSKGRRVRTYVQYEYTAEKNATVTSLLRHKPVLLLLVVRQHWTFTWIRYNTRVHYGSRQSLFRTSRFRWRVLMTSSCWDVTRRDGGYTSACMAGSVVAAERAAVFLTPETTFYRI